MPVMTDRTGLVLSRTRERVAELEAFTAAHRRLPTSRGPVAGERSLYEWMAAQRNRKGAHPVVLALVAHYGTRTDRQQERLAELRSFVHLHGRGPRRSTSYSKTENALAAWVVRSLANPELAGQVTEVLKPYGIPLQPPARPVGTCTPAAARRIEQLRAFLDAHGRLPRYDSDDAQERALYTWLRRPARVRNPEPELAEILGTPAARVDRVAQLEAFTAAHGRLPRPSGEERGLYQWMTGHTARRTADLRVTSLVAAHRDGA